MIPYGRQCISDEDVAAVAAALRDPFLTQGPRVAEFEQALARECGALFAVVFSSGTAALHGAYAAAGIAPGTCVITTPITFAATANAALYLGGRVEFADIDGATALLDPDVVGKVAGSDVRVLAPVWLGGHVDSVGEFRDLAAQRNWLVVEDACHALGATYSVPGEGEFRVGACAHSAMCCFSFHPVKHITTGEGGAVTTNDASLYRHLLRFRTHGITRDSAELSINEGPWYYEQHELGFNYRITDFQCALGLSQLRRLAEFLASRRRLAARYDDALAAVSGVRLVKAPANSGSAYHLYVVRVAAARRRKVFESLRAAGINANVHYIPVYRHPFYRAMLGTEVRCQEAERYYSEAISLPMYPDLTDAEQDEVIDCLASLVS